MERRANTNDSTQFAVELDEDGKGVVPADSRNRLDQILMKQSEWNQMNRIDSVSEKKQ